jgi:transposase
VRKAQWREANAAERLFKRSTTSAPRSRLASLKRMVKMARRHQQGILAFVGSRLTNAVAAGIHRIVKIVTNRARGFRHLHAFADLIYLTVGDVDIPAQIPRRFRPI